MIELIDIQAGFGGSGPGIRHPVEAEAVVSQLRRHRISRAVVRLTPETQDFDIERSNARLYAAVSVFGELIPCPAVAPAACGDLPTEEAQVEDAIRSGAMAVVLRPGPDCWAPEAWVVSPLLKALEERRLPVIFLQRLVPLATVGLFAEIAPDLPLIVAEVSYREHRTLMPLLQTFPNTYLSVGNNFTAHHGIELYAGMIGPERLLFGTGLPEIEPGAAMGQLLFADLSEADRERIGAGNARVLQERIRQ